MAPFPTPRTHRSGVLLPLLLLMTLAPVSCRKPLSEDLREQVAGTLASAERLVSLSQYEEAARIGFDALKRCEAEHGTQARELACETHTVLSRIYLQAYQDSLAWEQASVAEGLAREVQNDSLLATALLLKGQVCSYAGISLQTARDEEALDYSLQALALAEEHGYANLATDARYQLSEIYVNKNRWNTPLDPELYALAGRYLEEAEASDPEVPSLRSMRYHFRYLRQGNRTEESIAYCNQMIQTSDEDNHLLRQQMYDHLSNLYYQSGDADRAAECHQAFSYEINQYIRQKEDKTMAELKVLHEVALKDEKLQIRALQTTTLVVLLLIALGAIALILWFNRKLSQQKKQTQRAAKNREVLFAVIAKDLQDPVMNQVHDPEILDFFRKWPTMDEEEIIRQGELFSQGDNALDPAIADYVTDLMLKRKKKLSRYGLSARELEIISLSKEGLTDKQIADRLFLSPRTVSNHKGHIYAKLDVGSNAEMLSKIQELGL